MKKLFLVLMILVLALTVSACTSSERVSNNLNIAAEEFKLARRIAAINGFTDQPLFEVVGYCSIETDASKVSGMLEIICKIGPDSYTKDFIYLSDNVLIIVDQVEGVDVPQYHYQIVFTPQALLPIPEIITGPIGD